MFRRSPWRAIDKEGFRLRSGASVSESAAIWPVNEGLFAPGVGPGSAADPAAPAKESHSPPAHAERVIVRQRLR